MNDRDRETLSNDPNLRDRLNRLIAAGTQHQNQGRLSEAEECYRQIAAILPDWGDLHNNLGCVLQGQGKLDEAMKSYEQAVALNPRDAIAHHNLGYLLDLKGDLDGAAKHYHMAVLLKPEYAEAHSNLGNIHLARGELDEAERLYKIAQAIKPDYAEAHNNLGNVYKARGKLDEAARCYEKAITLKPDYADARNNMGCVLLDRARHGEAAAWFERALRFKPDYAEAHCNLGMAIKEQGKLDEAVGCYRKAIALKPDYAEAYNNLAGVLTSLGRLEEAAAYCNRALALMPGFAPAHCNRANILRDQGRLQEAVAECRQALALKPGYPEAICNLAHLKRFEPKDAELVLLETLSADAAAVPANKRPYIHFGLAKALEDIGDYSRSFEQLLIGNAIRRQSVAYDEPATGDYFRRIAEVFDAKLMNRCKGAGDPSSTPIFVLGMPRSGSTLIEQILSSHPQIQGAGELRLLSQVANRPPGSYPASFSSIEPDGLRSLGEAYLRGLPQLPQGKLRITDKMPANFEYLGLIHLILPNARIIHTMRNPADTCVSCFSKLFSSGMPYSYDLAELGRYYRYYAQLMHHWRSVLPAGAMLEVSYEQVIDDLGGQARRMIQFCGLEWDGRCLSFHKNDRPVSTASNVDVRRPLYRDSLDRWRRYAAYLKPLLAELNRPRESR